MRPPTIIQHAEPRIRPPLHFAYYRLTAFPLVLRRLREERAMSRGDVAEAAGLSLYDVMDLEAGVARPALDVIFALADVFHIDAADLLHDTRRAAEDLLIDELASRRAARTRQSSPIDVSATPCQLRLVPSSTAKYHRAAHHSPAAQAGNGD